MNKSELVNSVKPINKFLKPRECQNPDCPEKIFQPSRSDQKFCSNACKDHYHNSRKSEINRTDYFREKILRSNERKLARIYASPSYPTHEVTEAILDYEQVKIHTCTDNTINTKTNRMIFWSHRYGIELVGGNPRRYIIHKR